MLASNSLYIKGLSLVRFKPSQYCPPLKEVVQKRPIRTVSLGRGGQLELLTHAQVFPQERPQVGGFFNPLLGWCTGAVARAGFDSQ